MINFLKKFEPPHPSTIKTRWLRRVVICVMMPYAMAQTTYWSNRNVWSAAAQLWR